MPGIFGRPVIWEHRLLDCPDREALQKQLREKGQAGWEAGGMTIDNSRWMVLLKRRV